MSFQTGYSVEDRFGCPDGDSDGWSDPDLNWTSERSRCIPENPTQWSDMDGDGWGDNQSEGAHKWMISRIQPNGLIQMVTVGEITIIRGNPGR